MRRSCSARTDFGSSRSKNRASRCSPTEPVRQAWVDWRIVAQCQNETANATSPLVPHLLLASCVEALVLLASRCACRASQFRGERRTAATDQTRCGLRFTVPPCVVPTLELTTANATASRIAKPKLSRAGPRRVLGRSFHLRDFRLEATSFQIPQSASRRSISRRASPGRRQVAA
jgi:hypothetical protein